MNYIDYANRYASFFESLEKTTSFDEYKEIYDENVFFEDPFQKTYDLKSLHNVFIHMYETLYQAKFFIKEVAVSNNIAYIQWKFKFKRTENAQFDSFIGVSRVSFNKEGKATTHVDYWDSGVNIYEKIPLVKNIIGFIKKRLKA